MAPSIENSTHIVVLIDRSGSMATIASDVIGGFNTFVDDQRSNGNDARMSIIQFDSQDPQDVTVWGAPLAEITHLTGQTFQPRGGTPLLDATGLAIGRAKVDGEARVAAGLAPQDVIFVAITDGEENQSREFTLEQIRQLIAERTEGYEALRENVAGYTPEAMAPICGIDADTLRAGAIEWQATRGSRSGRVAWQYIQDLAGRLGERLDG